MSASLIQVPARDARHPLRRKRDASPAHTDTVTPLPDAAPVVMELQSSRSAILLQVLAQLAIVHGGHAR